MAQGMPEFLSSRGMNGFQAVSVTCNGTDESLSVASPNGYSPLKTHFPKRGKPSNPPRRYPLSLKPLVVNFQDWERSFDKFGDRRSPFDMENRESGSGGREALGQRGR